MFNRYLLAIVFGLLPYIISAQVSQGCASLPILNGSNHEVYIYYGEPLDGNEQVILSQVVGGSSTQVIPINNEETFIFSLNSGVYYYEFSNSTCFATGFVGTGDDIFDMASDFTNASSCLGGDGAVVFAGSGNTLNIEGDTRWNLYQYPGGVIKASGINPAAADNTLELDLTETNLDVGTYCLEAIPVDHPEEKYYSCQNISPSLFNTCFPFFPIELANLEATAFDQRINLRWQTESETDNDYFEIQRAELGSDFRTLQKIDGAGNSNKLLEYSWNDEQVLVGKTYYYRLKQVDFNGQVNYSKLVSANIYSEDGSKLSIFPNPTNSVIHLKSEFLEDNDLVSFYSADGELVKRVVYQNNKIDVSSFSRGVYFIKVINDRGFIFQRFVKH